MTSSNVILLSLKFESTMLSSWCEDPNYLARDALYLLSHSYIVLCLLLLGPGEASVVFFFCYPLLQKSSPIYYKFTVKSPWIQVCMSACFIIFFQLKNTKNIIIIM